VHELRDPIRKSNSWESRLCKIRDGAVLVQELAGMREENERGKAETAYLAPGLKFDQEAHERLMQETQHMESMLSGKGVRQPSLLSSKQLRAMAAMLQRLSYMTALLARPSSPP
jgi:hypothetical protein